MFSRLRVDTHREPGPPPQRAWRRAGRWLITRLTSAACISVLELAGAVGRAAKPFYGPTRNEIRAIYGDLGRSRLAEIAAEMRSLEVKHRTFRLLTRCFGLGPFRGFAEWRNEDQLLGLQAKGQGAILVTCHVGEPLWILVGLHKLRIPTLVLAARAPSVRFPANIEVCLIDADAERGALALKRSLDHLSSGGVLMIALDGGQGVSEVELAFHGRRIPLRRGAATLARLTGAPVLPIVARWEPWTGCALDLHEAFSRPACSSEDAEGFERALLDQASRWFGEYAAAHPPQLRLRFLRRFQQAPRAAQERGVTQHA